MGTFSLPALLDQSGFGSDLLRAVTSGANAKPSQGTAKSSDCADATCLPATDDSFQTLGASEDLTGIIYHAQMQRVAAMVSFQQASAGESGEDGAAAAESAQLKFSFFAESRVEELAAFQQRTSTVADKLGSSQKQSYLEASKQVSARFEFSMTISGEALSGFAGASEAAANDAPSFDEFLQLAQDTLNNSDEIFDRIFQLLDGFFKGNGKFDAAFNKLIKDLFGTDLFGGAAQASAGNAAAGPPAQEALQLKGFSVQMEFKFEFSAQMQVTAGAVQEADPIVLDLDGDGIELTSYRQGATFDILGNGQQAKVGFVTGGDAFLAMDRNGNGTIDSGAELFGDQRGAANGFDELAKLDDNRDGVINASDKAFESLRLWKDNGNGKTEPGELISLMEGDITEIKLGYKNVRQVAAGGNRIEQVSSFLRNNGSTGRAADAVLNFTV